MSKINFLLPGLSSLNFDIPSEISLGYVDGISDLFFNGPSYSWTLQTYLRLRESGHPCRLVESMPKEGIVVVHRGDLPFNRVPPANCILVTTLGDADWHPYAHVQIVQNPNHLEELSETFFIHHWTQPGLIPRSEDRGDIFKNVGYFGHPNQLADPLHATEWEQFLGGHDLNWIPVHKGSDRQSDYSDIDLIVAIRSFDGRSYDYKPATKLHNAWLAGVPAILGPESAYRAERSDEFDFLEARTYKELCEYIEILKARPALRSKLRERSEENRKEINPAQKAEKWWELLTGPVTDVYHWWTGLSDVRQRMFIAKRWLRVKKRGLQEKLVR